MPTIILAESGRGNKSRNADEILEWLNVVKLISRGLFQNTCKNEKTQEHVQFFY